MDGLGARERSKGGRGKKKGFEKEGGVGGGERMPTTPPLQCCDTRARSYRLEKGMGQREEEGRGRGSCMGNGKKIRRRRRSEEKVGPQDGRNIFPTTQ